MVAGNWVRTVVAFVLVLSALAHPLTAPAPAGSFVLSEPHDGAAQSGRRAHDPQANRRATSKPFEYSRLAVTGSVYNRMSATNVTMEADADQSDRTAQVLLNIPSGAFIDFLHIVIGNDYTIQGTVKLEEEAREEYEKAVSEGKTAALAASKGNEMFVLEIFVAAGARTVLTVGYQQFLTSHRGRYEYTLKLFSLNPSLTYLSDLSSLARTMPVVSVDLEIRDTDGLASVAVEKPAMKCAYQSTAAANMRCGMEKYKLAANERFDAASVRFPSLTEAKIVLEPSAQDQQDPDWGGERFKGLALDLIVSIVPQTQPGSTAKPAGVLMVDDNGYFAHVYRNPGSRPGIMPKTVVLLLDVSGSMKTQPCAVFEGCRSRLEQAQKAAINILDSLGELDEFAIYAFNNEGFRESEGAQYFRYSADRATTLDVMHRAGKEEKDAGEMFIKSLEAKGGTNIHDALMTGLDLALCDSEMPMPTNEDLRSDMDEPQTPFRTFAWFSFMSGVTMAVVITTNCMLCCRIQQGTPTHSQRAGGGIEMGVISVSSSGHNFGPGSPSDTDNAARESTAMLGNVHGASLGQTAGAGSGGGGEGGAGAALGEGVATAPDFSAAPVYASDTQAVPVAAFGSGAHPAYSVPSAVPIPPVPVVIPIATAIPVTGNHNTNYTNHNTTTVMPQAAEVQVDPTMRNLAYVQLAAAIVGLIVGWSQFYFPAAMAACVFCIVTSCIVLKLCLCCHAPTQGGYVDCSRTCSIVTVVVASCGMATSIIFFIIWIAISSYSPDYIPSSRPPSYCTRKATSFSAMSGAGAADDHSAWRPRVARSRMVLLLTDGQATSGITDASKIAGNVYQRLAQTGFAATVHALAFGREADLALLRLVATQSGGVATRIHDDTEMDKQVDVFFDSVKSPLMNNISMQYTALAAHDCASPSCAAECSSARDGTGASRGVAGGKCALTQQLHTTLYEGGFLLQVGRLPIIDAAAGTRAKALRVAVRGTEHKYGEEWSLNPLHVVHLVHVFHDAGMRIRARARVHTHAHARTHARTHTHTHTCRKETGVFHDAALRAYATNRGEACRF
jgi:hypothetical protein